MCGIFGFSAVTPITKAMAPILALAMEDRGDDSWGATNGVLYTKNTGSILDGWAGFTDWHKWDSVIFHTRGASVGSVSVQNAHPFFAHNAEGDLIIGVHNGGVLEHKEMNKKYKRDCQVDSEHIFLHMAEGKDLTELRAVGAVAWYKKGRFSFMKSGSGSLECVKLKTGEIIICSTFPPIMKALRMAGGEAKIHLDMKPFHEYYIAGNPDKNNEPAVFRGKETNFGKVPVSEFTTVSGRPRQPYRKPVNCLLCYRHIEDEKGVVCKACLGEGLTEVNRWAANRVLTAQHKAIGSYVN